MNTTPREDLHQSVQTIRDTVARLLDDYKYLEHAQSAGDDLVYAIEAFDHQLTNDLELYEEKLAQTRAMHGGG